MCCDGEALAATLAAHNSSGIDSKTACEETEGDAYYDKPLRSSGGTRQRRVWRSMCATETRRTQLHCKMYEAFRGIDLLTNLPQAYRIILSFNFRWILTTIKKICYVYSFAFDTIDDFVMSIY